MEKGWSSCRARERAKALPSAIGVGNLKRGARQEVNPPPYHQSLMEMITRVFVLYPRRRSYLKKNTDDDKSACAGYDVHTEIKEKTGGRGGKNLILDRTSPE